MPEPTLDELVTATLVAHAIYQDYQLLRVSDSNDLPEIQRLDQAYEVAQQKMLDLCDNLPISCTFAKDPRQPFAMWAAACAVGAEYDQDEYFAFIETLGERLFELVNPSGYKKETTETTT